MWHRYTKSGIITTNLKAKIELILPELISTIFVTWDFNVDKSTKGVYFISLGTDILTYLGLFLKIL